MLFYVRDIQGPLRIGQVCIVVANGESTTVGAPYVEGATVEATVLKNGKAKKITVFTYKPKKASSHKKQGHRQPYTKVRIEAIKA